MECPADVRIKGKPFVVERLKVLTLVAGYKPAFIYGGPIYSIGSLCETLINNGIDVIVLTTNANGKHDFDLPNGTRKRVDGVDVIYYRRITGDPTSISPAHTWALMKCIRQYDLVHIQGWWNWVAMMSLVVCKLYGVPHVLSPRGALSDYTFKTKHSKRRKKWMHRLMFKHMLNRTILHVTSGEEAMKFKSALSNSQIVIIPNIVSVPRVYVDTTRVDGPLKLIFLGRINPVKNIELIIRSLKQVSFPFTLQIVGDGDPSYIDELKMLIAESKEIAVVEPVYDEQKFKLLAEADLLVLVSHTENFGNVVIESISQGTAVLVSKNVGAADIVEQNDLGWVIEPDQESCIQALEEINLDRVRLKEIRQRGPAFVKSSFSPSVLANRYITECYALANPAFQKAEMVVEIE